MSEQLAGTDWDDYLVVLREDAHRLLAWSYADVRRQLPTARDEYDLTGWLAEAMDQRINNPKTPERFTLYSVHNERPISPNDESGKRRPKLDIQIERCGVRPKRYFTFEAKRLRDDGKANASSSLEHYLGEEGVMRFVADRYAAESDEAAMLGCIQAHDAPFWMASIRDAFLRDVESGENRFRILEQLREARVVDDLPSEADSVHRRLSDRPIRLFHILIDCQ